MRAALAACAVVAAGCAHMLAPAPDDAAAVIAAERAFAAESVRTDMRSAFLAHFAEDGVLLRGGWVNAREVLQGGPPPAVTLDWAPQHVEVARSGELALSTGPWIRTSRARPDAPAAHGHFVSIWRRQDDGAWKVEADLGISHPAAAGGAAVEVVEPPAVTRAGEALDGAEMRFVAASLRHGARAAYEEHALPRLLLYRDGRAPVRGKAAALASGALTDDKVLWFADGLDMSRSGDFGYVRGSYAAAADPARVAGHFLRVWRREGDGWGIALDVATPAR